MEARNGELIILSGKCEKMLSVAIVSNFLMFISPWAKDRDTVRLFLFLGIELQSLIYNLKIRQIKIFGPATLVRTFFAKTQAVITEIAYHT
jgi:hypothetical protein